MHMYRDARFVYHSFSIDVVNFWVFSFGFWVVNLCGSSACEFSRCFIAAFVLVFAHVLRGSCKFEDIGVMLYNTVIEEPEMY
jgi:hypothetical protein